MKTGIRSAWHWIFLALLLAGCSPVAPPTAPASRATTITCNAAYRTDVSAPIESEESVIFEDADGEQSIVFPDLVFHAAYRSGESDNERSLRVWVTDGAEATVYHSHLYQLSLDSGPQNQFQGGHGFTGLAYSYPPQSSAEMQFWCIAG